MLMDVIVLTTQLCRLDNGLVAIADLMWENPGMDFWKGTLNLVMILERPKKPDSGTSWR